MNFLYKKSCYCDTDSLHRKSNILKPVCDAPCANLNLYVRYHLLQVATTATNYRLLAPEVSRDIAGYFRTQ